MTAAEFTEYAANDAQMHRDSAKRALRDVIANAQDALDRLDHDLPTVRMSAGGSVLNAQSFTDAERALVRFWDAASYAAVSRGIEG